MSKNKDNNISEFNLNNSNIKEDKKINLTHQYKLSDSLSLNSKFNNNKEILKNDNNKYNISKSKEDSNNDIILSDSDLSSLNQSFQNFSKIEKKEFIIIIKNIIN